MKTALLITALLITSYSVSMAQIPDPVLSQIRADLKAAMQAQDSSVSADRIDQEFAAFEKEGTKTSGDVATSYAFTTAELEAFQKGVPTPTDEDMKKSVAEIIEMVGDPKRLPHLLAHYETLRAAGKLTPVQRILHQRTCRLVMANIKRHLESK